jgi:hypothetical protein
LDTSMPTNRFALFSIPCTSDRKSRSRKSLLVHRGITFFYPQ